jgi:serine/threonine protein kinase
MATSNSISFICPLTCQTLREPVTAEDGFIYESDAIRNWIREHGRSPKTKQKLSIDALQPNLAVQAMLHNFEKVLKSKNYKFKLNVDVRKEREPLFIIDGKEIFKANWSLTDDLNGPPIVILELEGVRAQIEAKFYEKFSHHPHILHTYGFVEQDPPDLNSVMLLQEYASEGDLRRVLKRESSIPAESVLCEIFRQVADGMKYLADNNVIHGDLACRNVLVFRFDSSKSKYNLIKLTDFGLSKGTTMYAALHDSSSVTSMNTIPVKYAAPEVLTSKSFSEKSDMYSMGVLMWEAYSKGMCPWRDIENHVVCQKMKSGERLAQPPRCSDNIWSIILACMSQKPEDRPKFSDLEETLRSRLKFEPTSSRDPVVENRPNVSHGVIDYPNGSKYTGEIKNGKRHGKGTMNFVNGNSYEGQFCNGRRHGEGVFVYTNGRRYKGEFQDGKRHGKGTYTSSPKSRTSFSYTGEFAHDKFDGRGFAHYRNNESYIGTFAKDQRDGEGIYNYANDDRYEGAFKNGKRNGYGKLTYANGDEYKGDFKNDKRHGLGSFACHNVYHYNGEFKEGMYDGHGIIIDENGYRYEGEFTKNTFCDHGTIMLITAHFLMPKLHE